MNCSIAIVASRIPFATAPNPTAPPIAPTADPGTAREGATHLRYVVLQALHRGSCPVLRLDDKLKSFGLTGHSSSTPDQRRERVHRRDLRPLLLVDLPLRREFGDLRVGPPLAEKHRVRLARVSHARGEDAVMPPLRVEQRQF